MLTQIVFVHAIVMAAAHISTILFEIFAHQLVEAFVACRMLN